ncbi:MAG: hypothetical protein M0P12_00220 [Paludibacteraceae bacterium]|jgi:hypothetical protein|nr:hypothetical protein [Paludibacteraceae bacterium]MCK9615563.1 hypothetical protein [Candidatus Omnitrophota bacterium]
MKTTKTQIPDITTSKTVGFAEARKIVRKAGFRNHQAYSWAKIEGRLPDGLPQSPKTVYSRYWKGWDQFLGLTK